MRNSIAKARQIAMKREWDHKKSEWDHNRVRNKTISFRASPEEHRLIRARITVSGLSISEYTIQAMLGNPIEIRVGKFESDRLSVELKRLSRKLDTVSIPDDAIPLLLECRALLEQVIEITATKKSPHPGR